MGTHESGKKTLTYWQKWRRVMGIPDGLANKAEGARAELVERARVATIKSKIAAVPAAVLAVAGGTAVQVQEVIDLVTAFEMAWLARA